MLLVSCNGKQKTERHEAGDTLVFQYAKGVEVVRYKDFTTIDIKNPWKAGKSLQRYVLVSASTSKKDARLPAGTKVTVPLKRTIVSTTAHCYLMTALSRQGAIKGVCGLQYIHVPAIVEGVKQRSIADCGEEVSPHIERMVQLKPDALLLSPFENSGGYGVFETLQVPIIACADYMESSALARAEWMKVYGILYGCEKQADSLFNVVEKNYVSLRTAAQKMPREHAMLTERKTGSVWYCPAGRSTIAQLIRDANGNYALSNDSHTGSLPLSFEQVLAKMGNADVWAFAYNSTESMRKADLLAEFSGYKALDAVNKGTVYGCNALQVPFFEETPFRPDLLLRDFIIMLHPRHHSLGALKYYRKLED